MNERRLNLFSKFMFMCVCKETLHIHPTNQNKTFQKIQDKKKTKYIIIFTIFNVLFVFAHLTGIPSP